MPHTPTNRPRQGRESVPESIARGPLVWFPETDPASWSFPGALAPGDFALTPTNTFWFWDGTVWTQIDTALHVAVTLGAGSDPALTLVGQELTLADVLTPAEHTAIGDGAPHHAAVTLAADADTLLGLVGQVLSLDTQLANVIFAGPAAGPAADPTFRAIVDADIPATITRDAEHGGFSPLGHHDVVTLGGGSAPELTLVGQELTLAAVLTPAEHTAIGDAAPHHAAVTLDADADVLLGLSGQVLNLDSQTANLIFAGPSSGIPADPTFRSLVDADIPAAITRDAEHGGFSPLGHHDAVTLAADADVLLALSGQELQLDTQTANLVFAGPSSGAPADPTFRAIVDADIPASIARDTELHAQTHGSPDHSGKIGETGLAIILPLIQPLAVGTLRAAVDYVHRAPGAAVYRINTIRARARSNLTTATTFRVSRNGTALSADATIAINTRDSGLVAVTEITLAAGDVLDVEELAGGSTQDVAVDVYALGDNDVLAVI